MSSLHHLILLDICVKFCQHMNWPMKKIGHSDLDIHKEWDNGRKDWWTVRETLCPWLRLSPAWSHKNTLASGNKWLGGHSWFCLRFVPVQEKFFLVIVTKCFLIGNCWVNYNLVQSTPALYKKCLEKPSVFIIQYTIQPYTRFWTCVVLLTKCWMLPLSCLNLCVFLVHMH